MTTMLSSATGRCWLGNHAPGASEILGGGTIEQYDLYLDTSTNNLYQNIDATLDALVWESITIPAAPHIEDGLNNAPNNAPTTLDIVTTLLGALTGEVNQTNTRQNTIADNLNDLATKFNTLLLHLETQGLQLSS